MTKTCTKCGETKPLEAFARDKSRPDGRTSTCLECRAVHKREWYAADPGKAAEQVRRRRTANPEKVRAATRALVARWRDAHPGQSRANSRAWYAANPEKARERNQRTRAAVKRKVFDHYGRACACCGSTDHLEIDHIDGGGSKHRAEIGSSAIYHWLVKNNFPAGFQALCRPCNRSKHSGTACRLDHGTQVAS